MFPLPFVGFLSIAAWNDLTTSTGMLYINDIYILCDDIFMTL